MIAGVDEVGRGALFGPVVAAAVLHARVWRWHSHSLSLPSRKVTTLSPYRIVAEIHVNVKPTV